MDLFGDEYIDNNLVFCSSNGRPMESQVINRAFNKLIKENGTASCCIPFSPSLQYHLQAETQWWRYEIGPGRHLVMLRVKMVAKMSTLTSSTRIAA